MAVNKEHSIKVPRLYKVAASVLKRYNNGEGGVKSLLFEGSKKHPNVKALYALVNEAVNKAGRVQNVLDATGIIQSNERLDPDLARILLTELLWGKGSLPGNSKPIVTILSYEKQIRSAEKALGRQKIRRIPKFPRYVRVNTLKTTMKAVKERLESEGYEELTYDKEEMGQVTFTRMMSKLEEHQFAMDLHVNDLLVFAHGTEFHSYELYQLGHLILQDKASCFSVQALNPEPGSVVLDACAAPGMKTSQLCSVVSPGGKVIAVERDVKRCQTLKKLLDDFGASPMVQVLSCDFLEISPDEHPDVQYIVVDPSCSGSGIVSREGTCDTSDRRLRSLSAVQKKLLLHALSFPNVKKVVYSTCSTTEEENEGVIRDVLVERNGFKLAKCLPSWTRRGLEEFKNSEKMVRVSPEDDLSNGFFVAVLKRRKNKDR